MVCVIEYEHWDDDADSTQRLVGPFPDAEAARAWARADGWTQTYDPRWSVRILRAPWDGVMQETGAIAAVEGRSE